MTLVLVLGLSRKTLLSFTIPHTAPAPLLNSPLVSYTRFLGRGQFALTCDIWARKSVRESRLQRAADGAENLRLWDKSYDISVGQQQGSSYCNLRRAVSTL